MSRLPHRPTETIWDCVSVLPDGFGVAVNHHATGVNAADTSSSTKLAGLFRTLDAGRTWHELRLDVRWRLVQALGRWMISWPVEEFTSLVLLPPDGVVLSWEDPWIYEDAKSHVIYSRDRGESWLYRSLGRAIPTLTTHDTGRLWVQGAGGLMESVDGGATWSRREFIVEWPPDHRLEKVGIVRHIAFVGPTTAYALIVHWERGPSFTPSHVGLVRTTDDGARWCHVHVFDGPDSGDVNERHMLTLETE